MLLGLCQVFTEDSNAINSHNNYNYIVKTKLNYNWKLFTTEEEPSKVGLV